MSTTPDWPNQWLIKTTLAVVITVYVLTGYIPMVNKAVQHIKSKTTKNENYNKLSMWHTRTIAVNQEGYHSWMAYSWFEKMAYTVIPFLTILGTILFVADGEAFQERSGDLWLKRHEAYTGVVVCFVFHVGFVFMIRIIGDVSNQAGKWFYGINAFCRLFLATFGLIIVASIFKSDHSDGLVPFTISVFAIMMVFDLIEFVIFCFNKEWALHSRLLSTHSE
jgi:hypothetical protein